MKPFPRARLRELGIVVGTLPCGPLNAITDVAGVGVGQVTLIEDEPHVIRSGVTAIVPLLGQLMRSGSLPWRSKTGNGRSAGTARVRIFTLVGKRPTCTIPANVMRRCECRHLATFAHPRRWTNCKSIRLRKLSRLS